MESTDAELYAREAVQFDKKLIGGDRIADTFLRFAAEERAHLDVLFGMGSQRSLAGLAREPLPPTDSLQGSLKTHADRELMSIRFYEGFLRSPLEPRDRLLVKGILCEEREHLAAIMEHLRGIKEGKG